MQRAAIPRKAVDMRRIATMEIQAEDTRLLADTKRLAVDTQPITITEIQAGNTRAMPTMGMRVAGTRPIIIMEIRAVDTLPITITEIPAEAIQRAGGTLPRVREMLLCGVVDRQTFAAMDRFDP